MLLINLAKKDAPDMPHKRSPQALARKYVKDHIYFDTNNKEQISLTTTNELVNFLSIIYENVNFSQITDLYSDGQLYDIRGTVIWDNHGTGSFQINDGACQECHASIATYRYIPNFSYTVTFLCASCYRKKKLKRGENKE